MGQEEERKRVPRIEQNQRKPTHLNQQAPQRAGESHSFPCRQRGGGDEPPTLTPQVSESTARWCSPVPHT